MNSNVKFELVIDKIGFGDIKAASLLHTAHLNSMLADANKVLDDASDLDTAKDHLRYVAFFFGRKSLVLADSVKNEREAKAVAVILARATEISIALSRY